MTEEMYAQNLLDHYRFPRNKGRLSSKTVSLSDSNVTCGDKLSFDLLIEKNMIKDISFDGVGCAVSQASASILSEYVKGKKVSVVKRMSDAEFFDLLGFSVTPARLKCALLCLQILRKV